MPAAYQFTVKANNTTRAVSTVTISGSTVQLALYTPIAVGETVKVSYSSGSITIRSEIGLEAKDFSDASAANQTTWADNVSGDYESADGGLGIKASVVTKTTDTSPLGRNANRYQITAEKLTSAYSAIRAVKGMEPKVAFIVPSTENAGLVSVSINGLEDAKNATPNASFEVLYKEASYTIPVNALDFKQIAQMMNAGGAVGQLLISIDTNVTAASAQLTAALNGSSVQLLSAPVNFELAVTNNGTTKSIESLKNFITRTITTSTALDPRQTAVVWLDPQTSKLSYVPTHVEQKNGQSVVTFKRKGNSTYAVVKGAVNYSDISKHWARNDLLLLANKYIIEGHSATVFDPEKAITRAEFAAFVARGLGLSGDKNAAAKFTDVAQASANAAYIGAAVKAGIVQGITDSTFKPNSPITREQIASMMVRAAGAAGVQIVTSQNTSTIMKRFKDYAKIGSWAQTNAAKAVDAGIINGLTSTSFGGKSQVTRAQAAVMIKRLLLYLDMLDE